MLIQVSSDSTVEMVVQDRSLPPVSPSHQNRYARSREQGSSSSKLKGVIPLRGGMWGARIAYNYKRYSLGTYETEIEAAIAYDRAAIKMPRAHSLNYPRSNYTIEESGFQSQYTIQEILSMLQDKTYSFLLNDFSLKQSSSIEYHAETFLREQGILYEILCKKELNDMDITHKCFLVQGDYAPLHSPQTEHEGRNISTTFCDIHGLSWTFGCSFRHSTQSFIITSGWGEFLKQYNLKEKDMVIFYRCWYRRDAVSRRKFYLVNVLKSAAESSDGSEQVNKRRVKLFGVEISG